MNDASGGAAADESEYWRGVLTGQDEALVKLQQRFGNLPRPPRCKLCRAPFKGPWSPFLRLWGFKEWQLNPRMCGVCMRRLEDHEGGAEVPVSLLFVDVRGSTAMAEASETGAFTSRISRFYKITAAAIDDENGVVDHLAGDGVMAMWIPAFVGDDHPRRALAAARSMAKSLADERLPAGVGVHTGEAFVGVIGDAGARDFTVLGDTANTTARLSSAAAEHQVAMSDAVVRQAHVDTAGLEHRLLEFKGKAEPFSTWVETIG